MANFVLIGVAGYIAPRHLKAIKDTNNTLIAALDKHDSVGILDTYFPECDFFTEFERFDRHIEKLKQQGQSIDYVVVTTPNYLHDAHIRFGLRHGANVICEKPLVLNPWNVDALSIIEQQTGKKIYPILQLRLHENAILLKNKLNEANIDDNYDIDLTYITPRGNWYQYSWKGDISKSGGIATNIGIHLFDLLIWLFGEVIENHVHIHTNITCAGHLTFRRAKVRYFLSIDSTYLANNHHKVAHRSLVINNQTFDFSTGFFDLHTMSYEKILAQQGFDIQDTKAAIQIVHDIRNKAISLTNTDKHPLVK